MYYKVLNPDGTSPIAHAQWSLPMGNQPGAWMPAIAGTLVKCERGYHAVPLAYLAQRLFEDACVYEVEIGTRNVRVYDDEVVVARRMRLVRLVGVATRRALVLWACDRAEQALPLYESKYPGDDRVRACIEITRQHLDGTATQAELWAARSAAFTAASAAANTVGSYGATNAAYAAAYADDPAAWAYPVAQEQERVWRQWRLLERLAETLTT